MAEISPTFKISIEFLYQKIESNYLTYSKRLPPKSHIKRDIRRVSTIVYFNEVQREYKTLKSFGSSFSFLRSRVQILSVFLAWENVTSKYMWRTICFKHKKFR